MDARLGPGSPSCLLLKSVVFEMALAFQRLCVFIAAENVLVELHVGAAKGLEEICYFLGAAKDFFREIVGVNVDADGSDHAILFSNDGNGGALKLAGAEVELVV